jgi:hypothetical protein
MIKFIVPAFGLVVLLPEFVSAVDYLLFCWLFYWVVLLLKNGFAVWGTPSGE